MTWIRRISTGRGLRLPGSSMYQQERKTRWVRERVMRAEVFVAVSDST